LPANHAPRAGSAVERRVARRFADAFEQGDVAGIVAGIVALLTADAWLTMPPLPLEYQGHDAIAEFLRMVVFRDGAQTLRLVATRANGQPAFGCYVNDRHQPMARAHGLIVLTLDGERITALTRFIDNSLLRPFALTRASRED
jgi:RNA polymerase sigma-70 factor (ECF subfamily)